MLKLNKKPRPQTAANGTGIMTAECSGRMAGNTEIVDNGIELTAFSGNGGSVGVKVKCKSAANSPVRILRV